MTIKKKPEITINIANKLADNMLEMHIINERLATNTKNKVINVLEKAKKDIIKKTVELNPLEPKRT